jgi:chloramphenicol-sensitive protein RarD
MSKNSFGAGVFFALTAYFLWGILPLYWKLLAAINPLHILGFRILFSLLLTGGILIILKNSAWLSFYKDKRKALLLILAALIITFNWGLYIWAINMGHTIEAALGYYINPLISVVLGLSVLKERLNLMQMAAFFLAVIGVVILTVFTGRLPWISLGLALSFGIYGLIKKTINLSALESLCVETLIASPLGIVLLFGPFGNLMTFEETGSGFSFNQLSYMAELPVVTILILLLCGVVTSLPLYLFARGAKLLPLSTLGFIQFVAPTLTFLTGVFIFRESFPPRNFIVFGFIWSAVIMYIVSLFVTKNETVNNEQLAVSNEQLKNLE